VANFEFLVTITGFAFQTEHYWALSTDPDCQCDRLNARGARLTNKGVPVRTATADDASPALDLFLQTVTQDAVVGDCHSIRGCYGPSTLVAAVTLREKGDYYVCYRAGERWRRVGDHHTPVRRSRANNYTVYPTVRNQLRWENGVEYKHTYGVELYSNTTRDALRSQCNLTIEIDGCGLQVGDQVAISTDSCCKSPFITGSLVGVPQNLQYVKNNDHSVFNSPSDAMASGYVYGGYIAGSNVSELGKVAAIRDFDLNAKTSGVAYVSQAAVTGPVTVRDIFTVSLQGVTLPQGKYYVCYQEYHEPLWEPVSRNHVFSWLKAAQVNDPDSFVVSRANLPDFRMNIYMPGTWPYRTAALYDNKPQLDWHIEDHRFNASGVVPDHLYTDCPFDIVLRGEPLCDPTIGFAISNSSDCRTVYQHLTWTVGELRASKQHRIVPGSRISYSVRDRHDDIVHWRRLTVDLAGTYYLSSKIRVKCMATRQFLMLCSKYTTKRSSRTIFTD